VNNNLNADKSKKVLVFPLACYDNTGGVPNTILILLKALQAMYDIVVVLPENSKFSSSLRHFDAKVVFSKNADRWSFNVRYPFKAALNFYRIRRALKPYVSRDSVIICNEPVSLLVSAALRLRGTKIVYFSRGSTYSGLLGRLVGIISCRITKAVAISHNQCEIVSRKFKFLKSAPIYIPNPVDQKEGQAYEPFQKGETRFGIVGFIDPLKNQLAFVKLVARLRGLGINAYGSIFGEVLDKEYYNSIKLYLREKQLEEFFDFKGFVGDKSRIYSSIDVLISTSLREGFGRTIVEGMSYGRLVAANLCAGGPLSIIDHEVNGLLYNFEELDETAEHISLLLKNRPKLKGICSSAVRRSQDFSIANVVQQITTLLRSL